MNPSHSPLRAWAPVVGALAACASAPAPAPQHPLPRYVATEATPAPSPDASPGASPGAGSDAAVASAVPSVPSVPGMSAVDTVRAALATLPVVPAAEAAWLPARLLGVIVEATGDLPAPTPPRFQGDAVTWGLLAVPGADAARMARACAAVTAAEPRVACATDTTEWSGAERMRLALGWRAATGRTEVTLAQPLRAIGRLGPPGACVASAQRTLRTLDVTVRVPTEEALGRLLAVATTAPALSDLILVRTEPRGGMVEALLSWPLDRADPARADMGDDPWPARCDGAQTVGQDAPPHTVPVPRMWVTGTRAHGAVMAAAHRDWVVTAGDTVAGVVLVDADARGATVRLPPRTRAVRLPWVNIP